MSTCQEVERNCGLVFTLTNRTNLLPNCTTLSPITQAPLQSDDSCNLIPSTGTQKKKECLYSVSPFLFFLSTRCSDRTQSHGTSCGLCACHLPCALCQILLHQSHQLSIRMLSSLSLPTLCKPSMPSSPVPLTCVLVLQWRMDGTCVYGHRYRALHLGGVCLFHHV